MRYFLTFIILILASAAIAETIHIDSVITLASDTTIVEKTPVEAGWKTIFTFQNVLVIFIGLYEITVRVYPTAKNWSAFSLVYNILNLIVPNKKTDGTKHK